MGLFDALGEMARNKYEGFKEDPAGTVSRAYSNMNDRYEKKREDIVSQGAKKARSFSDDELYRYADRAENSIQRDIAQREMERRGL
jgi:hypothetical protein